jgi:hypothetical protein
VFIKTKGINPADLINALRARKISKVHLAETKISRVDLGYSINSVFESNSIYRTIKMLVNYVLSTFKIGDSLEFLAEK